MTDYYKKGELELRHLVLFSKPPIEKDLYYYDFDTKGGVSGEWRSVVKISKLPYNLYTLEFKNNSKEDKCIVTCNDSYRLSRTPDKEPDHQALLKERKWRDSVVKSNAELEYVSDDKVYRAKVAWTKSDIIPGVLLIGPRECPNMNVFGYYYKESRRLQESGTDLEKVTEEQLKEEKRMKKECKKKADERDKKIKELKRSLRFYEYSEENHVFRFLDTLPYYQSLKRYPTEITAGSVYDSLSDEKKKETSIDTIRNTDCCLGIYGMISEAEDYDCCWDRVELEIGEGGSVEIPATTDGIFDIEIKDATHARLECKNDDIKISLDKKGNTFTLTNNDHNNPLFFPTCGHPLYIVTDGSKVSMKRLWIQPEQRSILARLNEHWVPSWLKKDKVLLLGHMKIQGNLIEKDRLVCKNILDFLKSYHYRKGDEDFRFLDTVPYYQNFKKYPTEITINSVSNILSDEEAERRVRSKIDKQTGIYGLIIEARDYDCCWTAEEFEVTGGYVKIPKIWDGVFDIEVECATLAYLKCGDIKISLDKREKDGMFTLNGNDYNHPFILPESGAYISIFTDGSKVSMKQLWIQKEQKDALVEMNDHWAVSCLGDKVLLLGHFGMKEEIIDKGDLEVCD